MTPHRPTGTWEAVAFTLIELLVVVAIIVILAAMLVPALTSAREKSRRSSCMSNFKQLGTALESYVGEYGGYYPSGHSWDAAAVRGNYSAPRENAHFSQGPKDIYKDPKRNESVYVGFGHCQQDASYFFDTIFWGVITNKRLYADLTPGFLKTGPIGLGHLVTSGYITAAQSLWCPSGADAPCYDSYVGSGCRSELFYMASGGWTGTMSMVFHKPEDVKNIGGFDAYNLTHGDFTRWPAHGDTWDCAEYFYGAGHRWNSAGCYPLVTGGCASPAIQCSYAYRNVPTYKYGHDGTKTPITVWGTRGPVKTTAYAPTFKTSRQQAGRALAADRFGKNSSSTQSQKNLAGPAWYMHKDGYNVLYGDCSVRWYGDPSMRYTFWDSISGKNGYTLAFNCLVPGSFALPTPQQAFWHDLDMFGGEDR